MENKRKNKNFYGLGLPEGWEMKKLREVAEIKGGYAFDSKKFKDSGEYQVVKMSNLYDNFLDLNRSQSFINACDLEDIEKESILFKDNIIITLTGTNGKRDYGYSYQISHEKKLLLNQRVAKVVPIKLDPKFLFYETKTTRFLDQFFYGAKGGTGNQANVSVGDLSSIKILLPPLPEQRAIAACLSTWDAAIQKNTQLIAQKERRKKWLMQQLLTGKKRLKGFEGAWKECYVREIAQEVSVRNKGDKDLIVLSCTKYDGLVPSLEYFGRRVFSEDTSTYKIVPENHFAYATNHIEEGSIGYQDKYDEALISPMYTVFKTDGLANDYFFYLLLKSHRLIHEYNARMEGSIDRRGGLRWDAFSIIKIHLPSLEEQTAIARILQTADQEIQLLKAQAEKMKEQKKGVMQQLLTGKKRLKHEKNI